VVNRKTIRGDPLEKKLPRMRDARNGHTSVEEMSHEGDAVPDPLCSSSSANTFLSLCQTSSPGTEIGFVDPFDKNGADKEPEYVCRI
jgi:hypothetical protein